MKFSLWKMSLIMISFIFILCGCSGKEKQDDLEEKPDVSTENMINSETEQVTFNENPAPTKEEVLAMREVALEGMTKEEAKRLTENIKVANLQMEEAYLYDDIFEKLKDKNSFYWNYFDETGEIQIGWSYSGTFKEINDICEEENITLEEFYQKYGTPVMDYNRFDAENFVALIEDMKKSVQNEKLKADLQSIIDETNLAAEMQEVEYVKNIYKLLHDMDYYLLRYGPEDVAKYTEDSSLISKFYDSLSVYH